MLYNTGTIAINGNIATGTGTNWAAPASQVRAGQTIIVMSNPVQMFQISSVNSATSMTVTPAASPALSGQKYGILVSDNISVDGLAQAMSQLIKEYDENIGAWETFATTSANQTITVTINGTSVIIPSIGALARKGSNSDITELKGLTTALSVAQGGTGAKTEADARTNLGLGSSATKDVGTATGNVMQVGAFGLGNSSAQVITDVWDKSLGSRFIMMSPSTSGGPQYYSMGIRISERSWGNGPNDVSQQSFSAFSMGGKRFTWMTMADGVDSGWLEVYHNGNTTKSSDGTLKAASPVINLFSDGRYLTNDESEGCTVTRLATGEYLVEGCAGLNSDAAWGGIDGGFDIPTDRNKQPLIWLDYEVHADGSVLVKTYHRTHLQAPAFARNELQGINEGDPVDIPRDQFVSIRVEMPADSIWNQRQKDITRAPVKE